jgi:hypothetical protein
LSGAIRSFSETGDEGRLSAHRNYFLFAVIQEAQTVSASCAFFSLLAVDLPTLGWRQA